MSTTEMEAPEGPRRRQLARKPNAFRGAFLAELDERNEPDSAAEADYDGPWVVLACPYQGAEGFGVFRQHERPPRDLPEAWFARHEYALLAVAVLPGLGRLPHFRLAERPASEGGGYLVWQGGDAIGYLTTFNEMLAAAMHVAECLVRSPVAMASLLWAASTPAVTQLGRILMARAEDERREGKR